ncbi:uncharacterized protein Tco025E_01276 [Trypanosoma conorhini]|uniref:TFIIS N-terminal domain-containing protein n=1 Tax=Trypanosoma conorhini TaxID=83891 RepID=A0A422Q8W9_9TRYP|nr:uncharacterized protein Tco025E_01276 [Trypanosoma conorhini]RNF26435.1 hypothetical protein Tco025E_01276 [Trypanosoma conorhini]
MSNISDDDDNRVLGIAAHDPVAAPVAAHPDGGAGGEAGEAEEMYLDLGPPSERDSDDAEAGDGGGGGSGGGGGGDEDDGEVAPLSDEALVAIASKTEAKALGRELYKRWKKLQKRDGKKERHRHDSKGKKKSRREDKKHKDKRSDRKRHRRAEAEEESHHDSDEGACDNDHEEVEKVVSKKKGKRTRREKPIALGDEELGVAPFADLDEVLQVEEAAAKQPGRGGVKGVHAEPKPKKLSGEAQRGIFRNIAAGVVNAMREARLKDEVDMNERRPPLHRVAIRKYVISQCRREALRSFLIEEGILQELSTWLYDFVRNELAAFELRSDALDILLGFPIDGELDAGVARNGDEILDAFTGMTREQLIHTDLGSAVNALRQSKQEVHQNRAKAVRLLERLSRAMAGGVRSGRRGAAAADGGRGSHAGGGPSSSVTWKCKDDPTVAPPFHTVKTGTEVFQSALARPDPLDPLSYLRLPPRRAPKAYVTNLGGNVGAGD